MSNEDCVLPTAPGFLGKITAILISPFKWLDDMLSHNSVRSSKRLIMFLSAVVLCLCLAALTVAIIIVLLKNPKDHKIDGNIVLLYTSLTVPIAGLAGAAYISKKENPVEPKNTVTNSGATTVLKG